MSAQTFVFTLQGIKIKINYTQLIIITNATERLCVFKKLTIQVQYGTSKPVLVSKENTRNLGYSCCRSTNNYHINHLHFVRGGFYQCSKFAEQANTICMIIWEQWAKYTSKSALVSTENVSSLGHSCCRSTNNYHINHLHFVRGGFYQCSKFAEQANTICMTIWEQ